MGEREESNHQLCGTDAYVVVIFIIIIIIIIFWRFFKTLAVL